MHIFLICFVLLFLAGSLLASTLQRHRRNNFVKRHISMAPASKARVRTENVSRRLVETRFTKRLNDLRERTGVRKLSHIFLGSALPSCLLGLLVFWLLPSVLLALVSTIFLTSAFSWMAIRYFVRRRHARFVQNLPNAIDTIVRAVTTGLPLTDGFAIIAKEGLDPLRSEFARVLDARKLGGTIPDALNGLAERVACPETRFLATVIEVQTQSGGSIAEALTNLSNVLRDRQRMKEKVRAMAAEAKASAYIIGSLPFFIVAVISYTSPDYMNILLTTFAGHVAIGGCLIWMGIGIAIMRKMINFEV